MHYINWFADIVFFAFPWWILLGHDLLLFAYIVELELQYFI